MDSHSGFDDLLGTRRGGGRALATDPGPAGRAELERLLARCADGELSEPLAALCQVDADSPLLEGERAARRGQLAAAALGPLSAQIAQAAASHVDALLSALAVAPLTDPEREQLQAQTCPSATYVDTHSLTSPDAYREDFAERANANAAALLGARGVPFTVDCALPGTQEVPLAPGEDGYLGSTQHLINSLSGPDCELAWSRLLSDPRFDAGEKPLDGDALRAELESLLRRTARSRYTEEMKEQVRKRYPLCRTPADRDALAAQLGISSCQKLYNLASRLGVTSPVHVP